MVQSANAAAQTLMRLIEEYAALFRIMQAPPAGAQASPTPFKDVADLGRASRGKRQAAE